MSKEHAMLFSVFLVFKFLSKDLTIAALTGYFIRGIVTLFATLHPSITRFLTKECYYKEVVSPTPSMLAVSVDFKSWVVASIPGFIFCMWYAAKKYSPPNNVLGISSYLQGIKMLSLGSLKTVAFLLLLLPTADAAAWPSSVLTVSNTVIPDIFVALALHIAVPRGSKNCFFNCTFLRCTVGLTVIIIISSSRAAEPALLYVAYGVIGFVAAYCLLNELKQKESINQLMGKVLDWNIYGTKLKNFDGWVLHAANNDGDGGEDDVTDLPENGDVPEDHDGHQDDREMALEDSDDDVWGIRAVQLLAIRANFPICAINGYDWCMGMTIYTQPDGEVQERVQEGMVDLVPCGPRRVLKAEGIFALEVFYSTTSNEGSSMVGRLTGQWNVCIDEKTEEYTRTICGGRGRMLEVKYLVIPNAIETYVKVRLKLKDLGSSSRVVYGKIKASATGYGNKWVHLFNCEQGRSLSFLSGSTFVLPLSPDVIVLPYRRQFQLHIEVDLTLITTCDSQSAVKKFLRNLFKKDDVKNLKFSLEFTREVRSQQRDVDGDQVEVNIMYDPEVV